mmetsp:Transcript_71044/g.156765  ORF Transcript_71044/g.156765 Transcript_71044/m.156765 type:complete len:213 (-) Transcript_71044:489-1127(-)
MVLQLSVRCHRCHRSADLICQVERCVAGANGSFGQGGQQGSGTGQQMLRELATQLPLDGLHQQVIHLRVQRCQPCQGAETTLSEVERLATDNLRIPCLQLLQDIFQQGRCQRLKPCWRRFTGGFGTPAEARDDTEWKDGVRPHAMKMGLEKRKGTWGFPKIGQNLQARSRDIWIAGHLPQPHQSHVQQLLCVTHGQAIETQTVEKSKAVRHK